MRYPLRDLGAELSAGAGRSDGGTPGSEAACLVPHLASPIGLWFDLCDPGHSADALLRARRRKRYSLDTTAVVLRRRRRQPWRRGRGR